MSEVLSAIPVYNGERFLGATLESLAHQTRPPDTVVVIDDGSTDGTCDVVNEFRGLRCELIRNERNLGLFPNLNHALKYAERSEYFHLLLADDCVRPFFLERLAGALQEAPPPSFAYCHYDWIDAEGRVIQAASRPNRGGFSPVNRETFLTRQSLLETISVGSVLIRSGRRPLPVVFRADMPHVADCVFFAELAAACQQVIEGGDSLCEIRRHAENATQRNRRNLNAWVADEFLAMQHISRLLSKRGWRGRMHGHRIQCLFAARSRVKQQWTRKEDPDFAAQIGVVVARETAWYHRLLGSMAVFLRDMVVGKNLPDQPR